MSHSIPQPSAYWKLNSSYADSVGTNTLSIAQGAPTFITGKITQGAHFVNANNDCLKAAHSLDLTPGPNGFTAACWFKVDNYNDSMVPLNKWNQAGLEWGIQCAVASNQGHVNFFLGNGAGSYTTLYSTHQGIQLGEWCLAILIYDAQSQTMRGEVRTATISAIDVKPHSGGLFAGTSDLHISGLPDYYSSYVNGIVDEVGYWKIPLSGSDTSALWNEGQGTTHPFTGAKVSTLLVVCDGDSETIGYQLPTPATQSWPSQLQALLGPSAEVFNLGVSGQTFPDMTSGAAMQIGPLFSSERQHNLVVAYGGTNGLNTGASQTYNDALAYRGALSPLGFEIVAVTLQDVGSGNETTRQNYANLLRADTTHFAALLDITSDALVGLRGATQTSYFQADQSHFSVTGAAVVAGLAASALSPFTDSTAPAAPPTISGILTACVQLTATAPSDIDVVALRFYLLGVQIAEVPATPGQTVTHLDIARPANTAYAYTTKALDGAGNLSNASGVIVVSASGGRRTVGL